MHMLHQVLIFEFELNCVRLCLYIRALAAAPMTIVARARRTSTLSLGSHRGLSLSAARKMVCVYIRIDSFSRDRSD